MQNPFRYGAKVTGGSFYDRREIKVSNINPSIYTKIPKCHFRVDCLLQLRAGFDILCANERQ